MRSRKIEVENGPETGYNEDKICVGGKKSGTEWEGIWADVS